MNLKNTFSILLGLVVCAGAFANYREIQKPVYPETIPIKEQLEKLKEARITVRFEQVSLVRALQSLSPMYYDEPSPEEFACRFILLDPKHSFRDAMPLIEIAAEKISLYDLIDKIASESGCVWWVDWDVVLVPEADYEAAKDFWRTRRTSQ